MGLVEELNNLNVFIDTAPFIYYIEKNKKYLNLLQPVFSGIDSGKIEAMTSVITLLEVLVHPNRLGNETLAEKYRQIILNSKGLVTIEIFSDIAEHAAKLRAKYFIRTPDAIQIATALLYGASIFLGNDSALKKITDIKVLVLDDFL